MISWVHYNARSKASEEYDMKENDKSSSDTLRAPIIIALMMVKNRERIWDFCDVIDAQPVDICCLGHDVSLQIDKPRPETYEM